MRGACAKSAVETKEIEETLKEAEARLKLSLENNLQKERDLRHEK